MMFWRQLSSKPLLFAFLLDHPSITHLQCSICSIHSMLPSFPLPFFRKIAPKHNVFSSMLGCGDGSNADVHWQTCTCTFLSKGTFRGRFQTITTQCDTRCFLSEWGPNCHQIKCLLFSSRLLPYFAHVLPRSTRHDFIWSTRPKATDGHFVCLPLLTNGANSYPFTKPFADGFLAHSSFVQAYNLPIIIISLTVCRQWDSVNTSMLTFIKKKAEFIVHLYLYR